MVELLIVVVMGLLVISAAATLGPRLGFAAPLLLVVVGIGASLLPFVPEVHVEPEWILSGVLPPLLYSAAVSMPSMNFRREFTAISGLSFVLVVVSSLVVGVVFAWLVPGLGLAWGIALGAIVSPTDAVATSIVKRAGAPTRVETILQGESLLNDATALVILRAAIAGAAAVSVSLWGVLGSFVYSIVVAGIIGFVVGHLNLLVRARVGEASVNTAISFTVPFLAAIPAEELGASGLVAAAVAGLATGHHAPQFLSAQHRLSDSQNWRTVELILEGTVFLTMGLELSAIAGDVGTDNRSIGIAAGLAAVALLLTILVRAAYVAPLLAGLKLRASRGARLKEGIATIQDRFGGIDAASKAHGPFWERRMPSAERVDRFRVRLRRLVADIDYLLAHALGRREGTITVWAGMRGAITLAAAQTLPEDAPSRSRLILIAFLVATSSLLLQGGTLAPLISRLQPAGVDDSVVHDERVRLMSLLEHTAAAVAEERGVDPARVSRGDMEWAADQGEDQKRLALDVILAQREALLDARDDGYYSADALNAALAVLDADQISLELKGAPTDRD